MAESPDSAWSMVEKLEHQLGELEPATVGRVHQLKGVFFLQESLFSQALEHLLKAERLFVETGLEEALAYTRLRLGQASYYLRQPQRARTYYFQALSHFRGSDNAQGLAKSYGHLGHYFEKQQMADSALFYQRSALGLAKKAQLHSLEAELLENLGSIYEDLENFDSARSYFLQALATRRDGRHNKGLAPLLNNLGDVYFKVGEYDSALTFTAQALTLAKAFNDRYQMRSAYRDLSQLYYAQQEHEKAYAYLDSSVVLYKEIYSRDGLLQAARLQAFYEADRKNREILLLEKDQRINRLIIWLSFLATMLLVVVAIAIYRRQRLKLRANRQVMDKREALYEAQEKLMKAELQNAHLNEQQLKLELESQQRALAAHTLHLVQKNQLLQDLKQEIIKVPSRDPGEARKRLKALDKKIDASFTEDADWDSFQQMFEQVHPSYFQSLLEMNPDLTQAELRLSALIKMHMSSKDMAAMLGISTDSLRIARYRLRKKLNLPREQKLNKYIQAIA